MLLGINFLISLPACFKIYNISWKWYGAQ